MNYELLPHIWNESKTRHNLTVESGIV